jgi:lipopolysaccharide/colanic/teichoic acid biosynthesis glycosyltransferase
MSAVGRLLRRTSLDELPQLWNILRGDMSLVGPRPERPYFVEQFSTAYPGYGDRHRMPAGLTGLAQVHGLRGDTSIADRVRFDNHYIDSWSLWQDVAIILRTVRAVFRMGGS